MRIKGIGILTYHDASNYGAFFQAYGTQSFLKEVTRHRVEIIDYRSSLRKNSYSAFGKLRLALKSGNASRAVVYSLAMPFIFLRNKNFLEARKKYFDLSGSYEPSNFDSLSNTFDTLVVGSDQVWNPKNNGGDRAYYLSVEGCKKISFSSSFACESAEEASLYLSPAEFLGSFQNIAVRESRALEILEEMGITGAKVTLDPVFFLSKKDWAEKFDLEHHTREGIKRTKRLFLYLNNKTALSVIKALLPRSDYRIDDYSSDPSLSLVMGSSYSFRGYHGPREFLRDLINSDLVLTTSYHAVVFSIIFNIDFIVVLGSDSGRNSRVVELLNRFELSHRVVASPLATNVLQEVNWQRVNAILASEVTNSKNIIKGFLD